MSRKLISQIIDFGVWHLCISAILQICIQQIGNLQMKAVNVMKRSLEFPINLASTSVSSLLNNKDKILSAINDNGCVCIKNVDFEQKEMIEFTKGFFGEVIELPKFLCFNNQKEEFKQVARVGNILIDQTLKDSQKEANYWHQDGNFWGEQKKHIYNCLHTRVIPDVGGHTHVMDLVEGAQFLKLNKPTIYQKLKQLIGTLNIEQIGDFKLYKAKNILNIESVTKHKLLKNNGRKGQQVLFLSVQKLIDPETNEESKDLTISQVHQILEKQMGFYAHKWEKGDLLIWDNLQVMHRSSGSFSGKRLLFRTQGRFI